MRKDMSKVIVERPRQLSRWDGVPKGRRKQDPHELQLKQEGIKRQKGGGKTLNENLQPLKRFIEGTEGRHWNKVHSELSEHIKAGNTVQEHVLSHLTDFITIKAQYVTVSAKAPCGVAAVPGVKRFMFIRSLEPGDLYVCPRDGIVKRARQKFEVGEKFEPVRHVRVSPDEIAVPLNGIWYAVTVKSFTLCQRKVQTKLAGNLEDKTYFEKTVYTVRVDDSISDVLSDVARGLVHASDVDRLTKFYGERGVFGVAKRQLAKNELRRLKLANA